MQSLLCHHFDRYEIKMKLQDPSMKPFDDAVAVDNNNLALGSAGTSDSSDDNRH